jgi:hypothetical protein
MREIERRAKALGWTLNQARGAKERIGATKGKAGFGAGSTWVWRLAHHDPASAKMKSPVEDQLGAMGSSSEGKSIFGDAPSTKITSLLEDEPTTKRLPSGDAAIFADDHPPLETADARHLAVTASTGTSLPLTRHPPCPTSPHGAHEYALLRDARGRRACIHCHTIEGTDGERLVGRRGVRKGPHPVTGGGGPHPVTGGGGPHPLTPSPTGEGEPDPAVAAIRPGPRAGGGAAARVRRRRT